MDWLYIEGHGILVDMVLVIVCLVCLYYLYSRNSKQVVALVQETPTAIFLVECQTGTIVDANRVAMQLLSIRRVGKRFLAPATISPQMLLNIIDRARSQPMQEWVVSENNKVQIHFAFNKAQVAGKKVWVVHATHSQSHFNLNEESLLTLQSFNALSQLVFLKDAAGHLQASNKAYNRFWMQREQEGCGVLELTNIEEHWSQKRWTTTPEGESCLLETHVYPVKTDNGKIIGSIGISYDVSDWFFIQQSCSEEIDKRQSMEAELQKSETLLQSILKASPYPIALMNQQRLHEACNQAYADSLGVASPEELIGRSLNDILPENLVARFEKTDLEVLEKGNTLRFLDMAKNIHGEPTWYDVLKAPYTEPLSGNVGCLVIARDVTEHIMAEQKLAQAYEKLERLSYFDTQLHLPNRRYFDSQLHAVWRLHLRQQSPLTVVACHIDQLAEYQKQHGQTAADAVLHQAVKALEEVIQRGADLLATQEVEASGRGEFIFLLPETEMPTCQLVIDKIHHAIATLTIEDDQHPIGFTASIGVSSVVPQRDLAPEDIVTCAEQALDSAKQAGGAQTQVHLISQK